LHGFPASGIRRRVVWNPVCKETSVSATKAIPFGKMNILQKLGHVCKICVFVLTLGFAYPNILLD